MPSYIIPAEGPVYVREGTAGSAFSRGDLLVSNASSELSKVPADFGMDIAGVALADSTDSINDKVTYAIPHADTVFWSRCTPGSTYTPGAQVALSFDANNHMIANGTSDTTNARVRAVCVKGVDDIENQSVESRIHMQFIRHDGNLIYS